MKRQRYPERWTSERVRALTDRYASYSDADWARHDNALFGDGSASIRVPRKLIPAVRRLLAQNAAKSAGRKSVRKPATRRPAR